MQIIPTILEKNIDRAEARLGLIGTNSKWVQIDVIDGRFTFGKSFELELLTKIERGEEYLWDIHLMVDNPTKWIEKCAFVQASRVIGQVELMANRQEFGERVKEIGMEAGLGFDIETEVDNIPDEIDLILLMGRKAGFGQVGLDRRVLEKIKQAKEYGKKIAVDGGVTKDNWEELVTAGVDMIYSGSNYFEIKNGNNRKEN